MFVHIQINGIKQTNNNPLSDAKKKFMRHWIIFYNFSNLYIGIVVLEWECAVGKSVTVVLMRVIFFAFYVAGLQFKRDKNLN